ncbi:uncharacterized protein N7515_007721 [Penicillium bovifimosum]|uniref:Mitotic checkpoint regulator, MAD2B-interacting-domain-containing protein n=1 Tax=Penicillium bovifimosum TaxID=126998 RepID=A0A9W9KX19_9EURO|nr:uncharacterized protein N7515_007721 [Penicillium bovifimosum]KAJ5123896.1 hypothetical protein N7515_007721 [Penicillium bovifimosum]
MALVAYSDSEGSDAEPETTPAPLTNKATNPDLKSGFKVDRSNPNKIRIAIPEIKPEHPAGEDEDGPRKKPRIGGGGFSGFNSFLPAPKRTAEKKAPMATTRKAFSLKTGAGPGFDRTADAEMKNDMAFDNLAGADAEDTIPAPGSLTADTAPDASVETMKKPEQVKLQGNPMMFRPLSVGRPKKKKTTKIIEQPTPGPSKSAQSGQQTTTSQPPAPPPPKPKVSLFSLSSDETTSRPDPTPGPSATYQPLVYNAESEEASEAIPADIEPPHIPAEYSTATVSSNPVSSLDSVANDLNLSKSERRQLFGRNATAAQSHVRTFNTDEEYASNQVLAQGELAAAQHNPVRSIAPGKHTLQQLLNAATSQKDALEESFATGRRNKREAGSKYGW